MTLRGLNNVLLFLYASLMVQTRRTLSRLSQTALMLHICMMGKRSKWAAGCHAKYSVGLAVYWSIWEPWNDLIIHVICGLLQPKSGIYCKRIRSLLALSNIVLVKVLLTQENVLN